MPGIGILTAPYRAAGLETGPGAGNNGEFARADASWVGGREPGR